MSIMGMFDVLFCNPVNSYSDHNLFRPWTKKENALNCRPVKPVICHPPCRLFGRLRSFSTAPKSEMILGYYSIGLVRKIGGIVEHPRSSLLWNQCQVGTPMNPDQYGGYLISVNLSWFGYPAQKSTGLYVVGVPYSRLPALPLSFDAIEKTVCSSKRSSKKEISGVERSRTPIAMVEWFAEVIQLISKV